MKLVSFCASTLGNKSRVGAALTLCLVMACTTGSPLQAQEIPGRREVLELLGYAVIEEGTPSEPVEKPKLRIATPRTTKLRVLSSTILTPLERERDYGDPWIEWNLECRYGECPVLARNSRMRLKLHLLIFNEKGEVIHSDGGNGETTKLQKGQSSDFSKSCEFSPLTAALESGTAVLVAVVREPNEKSWELIAYDSLMLDRLEPIRPR